MTIIRDLIDTPIYGRYRLIILLLITATVTVKFGNYYNILYLTGKAQAVITGSKTIIYISYE